MQTTSGRHSSGLMCLPLGLSSNRLKQSAYRGHSPLRRAAPSAFDVSVDTGMLNGAAAGEAIWWFPSKLPRVTTGQQVQARYLAERVETGSSNPGPWSMQVHRSPNHKSKDGAQLRHPSMDPLATAALREQSQGAFSSTCSLPPNGLAGL